MTASDRRTSFPLFAALGTGVFLLPWLAAIGAWFALPTYSPWVKAAIWVALSAGVVVGAAWVVWSVFPTRRASVAVAAACTVAFLFAWPFVVFASRETGMEAVGAWCARLGTAGCFAIGLGWVVWGLERAAQRYERVRRERWLASEPDPLSRIAHRADSDEGRDVWNPLDPVAWYYGSKSPRLNQSVTGLASYSLMFLLMFLLATNVSGCSETYELPAGGGEQTTIAQTVRVQKVIRKKFVVNPFSAILFEVPPIDEVQLQIEEVTAHLYKVGYGQGAGAGFAGGTKKGKVRFIRLEYSGGDWDQDFGVGADLNMLVEYGLRTQQKVENRTESRTVSQLRNFPAGKSPPMVYLTGQRNISLSKDEAEVLREYLLEKHGMLFGDNGGSRHFHNQFLAMMNRVLPGVRPVPVPLDDVVHRIPYRVPFVPYVAPHGGTQALGWRVEGRWVCYYHPGDIADAWSDDHAGVKPEIAEYCYQLGTNVIFYAHAEYAKWLQSRGESQ